MAFSKISAQARRLHGSNTTWTLSGALTSCKVLHYNLKGPAGLVCVCSHRGVHYALCATLTFLYMLLHYENRTWSLHHVFMKAPLEIPEVRNGLFLSNQSSIQYVKQSLKSLLSGQRYFCYFWDTRLSVHAIIHNNLWCNPHIETNSLYGVISTNVLLDTFLVYLILVYVSRTTVCNICNVYFNWSILLLSSNSIDCFLVVYRLTLPSFFGLQLQLA